MKKSQISLGFIIIIFLVIIFIPKYSSAQDSVFYSFTISKPDNFPEINVEGRVTKDLSRIFLADTGIKRRLKVFEGSQECEIIDFNRIKKIDTIQFHIIINGDDIKGADFLRFSDLLQNVEDKKLVQCQWNWYAIIGDSIHTIKFDSLLSIINNKIPQDFSALQNYIISENSQFSSNNSTKHCLIYYTSDLEPELLGSFSSLRSDILLGIVFKKDRVTSKNEGADYCALMSDVIRHNLLFALPLKDDSAPEKMENFIKEYLNSFFQIKFNAGPVVNLNNHFLFNINFPYDSMTYSNEFIMDIPPGKINNLYKQAVLNKADEMSRKLEYEALISFLHKSWLVLPDPDFEEYSRNQIGLYKEHIINTNTDPDRLFKLSENIWKYSPEKDPWYFDLKMELLNFYYKKLAVDTTAPKHLLQVNKERLQLMPDNEEFILTDLYLQGDVHFLAREYTEAAASYYQYLQISDSKQVFDKFSKNLNLSIDSSYRTNQSYALYITAKKYYKYMSENFILRYYFAEACVAVNDFALALENYEWIDNNWNDNQGLISWDELLIKLKYLYTLNYQYGKAMDLDQRYYRRDGGDDLLISYLTNMRLKYLKPVSDGLRIYLSTPGAATSFTQNSSALVFMAPDFLSGIYVMGSSGQIISKLYSQKTISPPSSDNIADMFLFPALLEDENNAWLINKSGESNYVIIEIRKGANLEEDNMLNEIREKKLNAEPWKILYDHEEFELIRFSSQFITGLITAELYSGTNNRFQSYWKALGQNKDLIYMLRHDEDGGIIENSGFDKGQLEMDDLMWGKSSTARAYFILDINYNGIDIYDVSNPIFVDEMYKGTIRFGIIKHK